MAERRRLRHWQLAVIVATVLVLVIIVLTRITMTTHPTAADDVLAGMTVSVGGPPSSITIDEQFSTTYVAVGRGGMLAMVDTASCNASRTDGCADARRVSTGSGYATVVAVNTLTHTLYVGDGPHNTIAVINAATCNAMNTSGCSSPIATIHLNGSPQSLAVDPGTDMVYASILTPHTHEMAVINSENCNSSDAGGCDTATTTIPLGQNSPRIISLGPVTNIMVDARYNIVYAAAYNDLAVINGRACRDIRAGNCMRITTTVPVYGDITGLAVTATGTIYVTSPETGTVTALDARTCGTRPPAGCGPSAKLIRAGPSPYGATDDPVEHTLYVTNEMTNTVSMIDTDTCEVTTGSGCAEFPAAFPVGDNPGAAVTDTAIHTVYVANLGANSLSVINSETCNAMDTRGCPKKSPRGTTGLPETPYTCYPEIAAYESGEVAQRPTRAAIRVASGSASGVAWSVWARKGLPDPNGIEQGGLVVDGRWYSLCRRPLSPGADGSMTVIDTPVHGIVYGFIQHSSQVKVTLTGPFGQLALPYSILLKGMTFFIEELPRSACSYRALALRVQQANVWSGSSNLTLGLCEPDRPVAISHGNSSWGPDADN